MTYAIFGHNISLDSKDLSDINLNRKVIIITYNQVKKLLIFSHIHEFNQIHKEIFVEKVKTRYIFRIFGLHGNTHHSSDDSSKAIK